MSDEFNSIRNYVIHTVFVVAPRQYTSLQTVQLLHMYNAMIRVLLSFSVRNSERVRATRS
jgi:hypothetical protein